MSCLTTVFRSSEFIPAQTEVIGAYDKLKDLDSVSDNVLKDHYGSLTCLAADCLMTGLALFDQI